MKIFPHMLLNMDELQKDPKAGGIEKYMEIAKCKNCRFVMQSHEVGKSQHMDFRMEVNDHLVGWSFVGGNREHPITFERLRKAGQGEEEKVRAEEKCFSRFCNEWMYELINVKEDGTPIVGWKLFEPKQILSHSIEMLARQPKEWLKVHGEVAPGGVGGGVEAGGKFTILTSGRVYQGAQKPYFHEYFVDSPELKETRIVIRAIATQRIDPDSKEKIPGTHEVMWNAWIPKDQDPYAVTRGRKKGWKPPRGLDPVPPWWKEKHKEEYEDWKNWLSGKEKEEEAILATLDGEPVTKQASFSLQQTSYKGPKHIRDMPKVSWWLLLKNGSIHLYKFDENPLYVSETFATDLGSTSSKYWKFEGEIPPGAEPFNPTKVLPATSVVLDSGVTTVEGTSQKGVQTLTFHFKGKKLTGNWSMSQEEKGAPVFLFTHLSEDEPLRVIDVLPILQKKFVKEKKQTKKPKEIEPWSPRFIAPWISEEFTDSNFVLQRHFWDEKEHWDLRILSEGEIIYWSLNEDPREKELEEPTKGIFKVCGNLDWMEKGKKGPEKVEVSGIQTQVEIVDSGNVLLIENSPSFKSMKLRGKSLKGYYIAKKDNGTWSFLKSHLPETD